MKYIKKSLFLLLCLTLLCGLTACGSGGSDKAALQDVVIVLDWTPNTNHTGLYVAKNQGYFEELGYNVEIIQPSQGTAEQLVASGQADYGVSYEEGVIQARVADVPVVSLAAVIQHNSSALAAPTSHNIKSPADFGNKKYGSYGSEIEEAIVRSLAEQNGVDASTIEMINVGEADFFTSTESQVDFSWIFYAWDGIKAQLRGDDLDMIMIKDEDPDLDYYTPVIITNEDKIASNPEQVKDIMAAISKGYQFCINDPAAAADILLQEVPELDAELVKASQNWLADQYQADAANWGWQDEAVWGNFTQWLLDHKLIAKNIDITKTYTNEYLPQ